MEEPNRDPSMLPISERLRFFASGAALGPNDSQAEKQIKPIGKLTLPQTFLNDGANGNGGEAAAKLRKIGKIKSPFLDNFQQTDAISSLSAELETAPKKTFIDQLGETLVVTDDKVNVTVARRTHCLTNGVGGGGRQMVESCAANINAISNACANIASLMRAGNTNVTPPTEGDACDHETHQSTTSMENGRFCQDKGAQKINVSGASTSSWRPKETPTVGTNARKTQSLSNERHKAHSTKKASPKKTHGDSSTTAKSKSAKDDAKRLGRQKKPEQFLTQPSSSKQAQSFGTRAISHPGAVRRNNVRSTGGVAKSKTRSCLAKEQIEKQTKRSGAARVDAGGRRIGQEKRK